MDVSHASYYIQTMKINKNKGSQMGHTKKKIKKKNQKKVNFVLIDKNSNLHFSS
jgi:hypothetical protein